MEHGMPADWQRGLDAHWLAPQVWSEHTHMEKKEAERHRKMQAAASLIGARWRLICARAERRRAELHRDTVRAICRGPAREPPLMLLVALWAARRQAMPTNR